MANAALPDSHRALGPSYKITILPFKPILLLRAQLLPRALRQLACRALSFWADSGSCLALRMAWRMKTNSSKAKPAAKVEMMAIKAIMGFDFLSGGWAASSI